MTTSNFGLMTLQGISKPLNQIAYKKECISLMENQLYLFFLLKLL